MWWVVPWCDVVCGVDVGVSVNVFVFMDMSVDVVLLRFHNMHHMV